MKKCKYEWMHDKDIVTSNINDLEIITARDALWRNLWLRNTGKINDLCIIFKNVLCNIEYEIKNFIA